MSPRLRNLITTTLKVALAGGLFYWLLSSGRLELSSLDDIWQDWHWLLAAQVLYGLTQVLSGWRWQLLLEAQGIKYSLGSMFSLTLVGLFFNQIAFGSTGGDFYRAYAVAQGYPGNRSGAIVSVFVDRAFGLFLLLLLVVAAAALNFELVVTHVELASIFLMAVGASVFVVVLFAVYFRRPGSESWLGRLFSRLPFQEVRARLDFAVRVYSQDRRLVLHAAVLSLLIQLLIVGANICLARALLDAFAIWPFLILVPAAHLAMAIPINPPGALGTAEAIYAYLFELVQISVGGVLALLQRATIILWSIAGAIIFVYRKDWPALNREVEA